MRVELWHKNGEWAINKFKMKHVPAVGDEVLDGYTWYLVTRRFWYPNYVALIVEEITE